MKFRPETLMNMAVLVSRESKCVKYQVGCVIEKDGRIIATGCNGTPAGALNCCDVSESKGWDMSKPEDRLKHREWSDVNEIHAEMNAVMTAGESVKGANVYVTVEPCNQCAKNLVQAGIKSVTFIKPKSGSGVFMGKHGVHVVWCHVDTGVVDLLASPPEDSEIDFEPPK